MSEQKLYEEAMELFEDVAGFVAEPLKTFGLRKHRSMKKDLQKKIEVFDFKNSIVSKILSVALRHFYIMFFLAAKEVIEDTYDFAYYESMLFKTTKRKQSADAAFIKICASQRKFRAAKLEIQRQRSLDFNLE